MDLQQKLVNTAWFGQQVVLGLARVTYAVNLMELFFCLWKIAELCGRLLRCLLLSEKKRPNFAQALRFLELRYFRKTLRYFGSIPSAIVFVCAVLTRWPHSLLHRKCVP